MAMPAIRRRWTAEAVRALTNEQRAWPRYELVRGELVVTPAPGAIHQVAVLEKLKGGRAGQYSIRVNDQWRICFRWKDADAYEVEIVDYH